MGGGKTTAPAAPDYTPIATSDEQAAQLQYQLGQQQLQQAQTEYNNVEPYIQNELQADSQTQTDEDASAKAEQQFYDNTYQPIQQDFASKASSYDTPQMEEQQAGMAGAAVNASYDGEIAQSVNQLAAMGIDPSQARSQALDSQMSTAQAAARAGAENQARVQTQQQGLGLEAAAIGQGQGLPTTVNSEYSTGTGAGATGVGSQTSANNANTSATSAGANTISEGTASNSAAAGALSQGYNASLNEFNANQNASSGVGSLLGSAAGLGLAAYGVGLFAEGGPVPYSASPSGGMQTDDIDARLNAGEFVMPKDVVAHKGIEFMQGIVDKTRKSMGLPTGSSPANQQGQAPPQLPAGASPLPAGAMARGIPGAASSGPNDMPLGRALPPQRNATPMSRPQGSSPMRSFQSVGLPV